MPETGTYYFKVGDYGENEYSTGVPYTLTVTVENNIDGAAEPGDDARTGARALTNGADQAGYIGSIGDCDWYKFEAVAGQLLQVALSRPAGNIDPCLRVENTAGTTLWNVGEGSEGSYNANVAWTKTISGQTIAAAGTCYVRVWDYGDNEYSTSVPYTLTVTLTGP